MSVLYFPKEVNERAARLVAGAVALSVLIALPLDARAVIPVLAAGFWLRVLFGPRVSPLARLAVWFAPRRWPVVLVPGAPKRFAQGVGALFTTISTILLYAGAPSVGWSLAAVILLCAAVEATQAFCVGCWMYGRLGPLTVWVHGRRV